MSAALVNVWAAQAEMKARERDAMAADNGGQPECVASLLRRFFQETWPGGSRQRPHVV